MHGRTSGSLLQQFVRACSEAGARAPAADVEGAGMDLLRRWSEPTRGYHDRTHLIEVLDRLAEIGGTGASAAATRLAAWFHDAVYAGRPGDDEEASADLARQELRALGVGDDMAERVATLVLVTAHHRAVDDEARALCDADLAVLASDDERYAAYTRGVRKEYAHVPEEQFQAGRAAVLSDLLAREDLFHTDHGRRHWNAVARQNLARELGRLQGRS